MRPVDVSGDEKEKVFVLAMSCQPTPSQWSQFDRVLADIGVFARIRRQGGLIRVRVDDSSDWQRRCRFAGRNFTTLELPQAILRDTLTPLPFPAKVGI